MFKDKTNKILIMELSKYTSLTNSQLHQVNELWNNEFPTNLNGRFNLFIKEAKNFTHYLIEDDKSKIAAWAASFEKDDELRFTIIVDKKQQGKGYGSTLINCLKADLNKFFGWVIDHNNDFKKDGSTYTSPLSFYLKHGFAVLEDLRSDNEILKAVKIKWSI